MATKRESFENLTVSANTPLSPGYGDYGFLQPGFVSAFTFSSGLKLLAPVPNDGEDDGETLVGDFDVVNEAVWGLGGNGKLAAGADIPSGSAYIGANKEVDGTLTFGFPGKAYTVSAFVTAYKDADLRGAVTATAYDASGKVLAASRILGSHIDDWEKSVVKVQSKKPIAKIVFTGDYVVLDDLSFATHKPDSIKGTNGKDTLGPAAGKDPSNRADLIFGKGGNDKISGAGGADHIYGGQGRDKLRGGDGNDTLVGGKDKDKLRGDAGQDSFLLNDLRSFEIIKDFKPADDSILLARKVFTELSLGTLGATKFGTSASSADIRIIYETATGRLLYDTDGNGPNGATQIAKVSPGLALTAEHFFVV